MTWMKIAGASYSTTVHHYILKYPWPAIRAHFQLSNINNLSPPDKKWQIVESIHLSTYITHVKDILSTKALSAEIKDLESQYNANSRLCGKSYYSMSTQTFHIINLCINQIEGTKMLSNMLPTLAPNSSVLQLCIMQKAVDALSYLWCIPICFNKDYYVGYYSGDLLLYGHSCWLASWYWSEADCTFHAPNLLC